MLIVWLYYDWYLYVFIGSLPQFFNAWVDCFLYSYDLSLKAFSVGLLNLFRLKTQRNKRSEPYYHPFCYGERWEKEVLQSYPEKYHSVLISFIRSLGNSLSSETHLNSIKTTFNLHLYQAFKQQKHLNI